MTISDSIPVQFWVNGVETYNQKEVCGITPICFCQPFNCDDEIRIQFRDTSNGTNELLIIGESGEEIDTLSFSEIAYGVYQLSFVPSEIDICDEVIRFIIYQNNLSIPNTALEAGYQNSPTGVSWDLNTDPPEVVFTFTGNGSQSSRFLYKSISSFVPGDTIDVSSIVRYVGSIFSGNVLTIETKIHFLNSGLSSISSEVIQTAIINTPSGFDVSVSESNSLLVPANTVYIGVQSILSLANYTFGFQVRIYLNEFEVDGINLASSDCIDVRDSHECTELIRYNNSKDFADIEYTDISPNADFYIRIPAVFFHETNPTEEERFETSGQTTVRMRDEIKVKRNLQVGYMPDYMHRKLLLILAHDTVEIDGDTWVRSDPYEKVPPANKRYPLKMANVLLTLQGYIKRNIL